MKKILCFIDSLSSGGAQRQLVGLAIMLKNHRYDVKVITYHDIPFYRKELEENDVCYENIGTAKFAIKRIYNISKAIKKYNPDIVISYLDVPNIIACLCKLFRGHWKLIVSERNTTQKLTCRERIKFYLYRFADIIVANSFSQKNFIVTHYQNYTFKITTITNFTDTERFHPDKHVNHNTTGNIEIIGVGRVSEQKNILSFVQALKIVKKKGYAFHVNWYGAKFPEYYQSCINEIKSCGLEDEFTFVSACSNIEDKYREADVFCLPSIYEGFPNVLCEAMSCGLPVLCSNVCDNPMIVVEHNNALLFNPLDVNDIADKIIQFIKLNDEEKVKWGQSSRKLALDKFSKQKFIDDYISILNRF